MCGGSKYGACMAYVGGIVAIHALDYMAGVDLLGLSALGVNATFLLAMLPALLMQCQMRNKIRHKYGIKVRLPLRSIVQYTAASYSALGMGPCEG